MVGVGVGVLMTYLHVSPPPLQPFPQVHLFPCSHLTGEDSYEACNWHQAGVISAPYVGSPPSPYGGGGHTFQPCGEVKSRGEAPPLSQESEIVSSALNLHFINCSAGVCVFFCSLHTDNHNTHSTREVRTLFGKSSYVLMTSKAFLRVKRQG